MNISKFPIFIVDGGDILAFGSVEDAELDLEAIDVTNACYVGYDAEGRLLRLDAMDEDKVSITLAEEDPLHKNDLLKALSGYLIAVDAPATDPSNLQKLVESFRPLIRQVRPMRRK